MNHVNTKPLSLRDIRDRVALSLIEVGEKIEVDPATVSGWETGKFKPSPENRRKLATLYDLTTEEIWNALPATTAPEREGGGQ